MGHAELKTNFSDFLDCEEIKICDHPDIGFDIINEIYTSVNYLCQFAGGLPVQN